MPIGIAHRQLYPIGFPWEKQGISYELQSKRTTGPCCITPGSFGLFLSVDHATDQQTLKRPFWGRIPVEGWDHSLNYCLLPLPVGSRLRPAFAMWQCFQGSRPGCGRGNDDSDMGQKVPPPTWPVATPMSRACAGAHGRHGRTVQSPSHSTRVQPRQGNPDVPADTPVPEGQS